MSGRARGVKTAGGRGGKRGIMSKWEIRGEMAQEDIKIRGVQKRFSGH